MAKFALGTASNLPSFYNISENVGTNCPNRPDDVELVSFLMMCAAKSPKIGPKTKERASKVKVTKTVTPEMLEFINNFEANQKVTVDNHISVAKNSEGNYVAGDGKSRGFIICTLNWMTRNAFPEQFPRLDKLPGCPASVATLVKKSIVGVD